MLPEVGLLHRPTAASEAQAPGRSCLAGSADAALPPPRVLARCEPRKGYLPILPSWGENAGSRVRLHSWLLHPALLLLRCLSQGLMEQMIVWWL